MKRIDRFCIAVIIVVSCSLIVLDLGRTFAYFVGPNGEIITSTLNGVTALDGNLIINSIPVSNNDSNSNAIVVRSGNSNVNNSEISKTGDGSAFDGSNAAVLINSNSSLTIISGSIITDGSYADAIYANGGRVSIAATSIQTVSNNSNGLVADNNGNVIANYLSLETSGEYSSAIYNKGGEVIVNGGNYKTKNNYSPAIVALGNVTVNYSSKFVAEKSEGIVIEGNNTVTFNNSSLTSTDTSLFNNSTKSKGVMLYQSSNKDSSAVATFDATGSNITTNVGDSFYVTNTKAVIELVDNTIVNNTGEFLRIESSNYGVIGSNGGDVVLNMSNQDVSGDILVDDISKLEMNMSNGSTFEGAINSGNESDDVSLKMSADSVLSLTGDTYISSLDNADSTNSNIHLNGYDLYVDGKKLVIGGSSSGTNNGSPSPSGGNTTGGNASSGNTNGGNTSDGTDSGTGTGSTVSPQPGNSGTTSNGTTSGNTKKGSTSGSKESGTIAGSGSSDSKVDSKSSDGTSSNSKSSKSKKDRVYDDSEIGDTTTIGATNDEANVSNSSSIYIVDDRTLIILNVIGVLLIATAILSLVKIRTFRKVNEV